jgi:hypothetical protein
VYSRDTGRGKSRGGGAAALAAELNSPLLLLFCDYVSSQAQQSAAQSWARCALR